jgi:hypothetical protein
MCNPRQVRVRAARQLEQAWEEEVRRQVTRSAAVVGEARVREPLQMTIGAPTLAALTSVLDRTPGWEWDGEGYVHQLDGGYLRYDPVARELTIVARLTDQVEVVGSAGRTVSGTVSEVVEAEGQGTYYDDGYAGRTERTARADAQEAARAALDSAAAERVAQARAAAAAREGAGVEAAAAARADRALAEAGRSREAELAAAARARLDAVGVQGRNLFHAVLAGAYRDAVLAYARSRGASGVRCTETDGVIDIEFEMQA